MKSTIIILIVVILTIEYYLMIKKEQFTDTSHNLEESHRYYAEWKKTDIKKNVLYVSIYKVVDNGTLVAELKMDGCLWWMGHRRDWEFTVNGHEETFWNDSNILHFE